ncbi:MAG: DUF4342 domain-containing protein [Firmicutes bacterium]|nr:DUF4342 domain-containing protein [Bacillota bacterium]
MEITLEKIELVKDRTGVSYKEAKEALEAADGSVVDAIIAIEETVDVNKNNKAGEFVNETMEKIKELVKKGNISKISVKRDDETMVNIPVNVGIVGTIVAPWGVVAAAIAAFGFKCKIELTTDEGKVIDISQKAETAANEVKERGSVVFEEVMAKGTDVVNDVKEKAPAVIDDMVKKGTETYNIIKDAAVEKFEELKKKGEDIADDAEDAFEELKEKAEGCFEKEEKEEDK